MPKKKSAVEKGLAALKKTAQLKREAAVKAPRAEEPKEPELEQFVRVKRLNRDGDWLPAYQPEVLTVEGDRVVKRELVSKPDVIQMVMLAANRLIDPRKK